MIGMTLHCINHFVMKLFDGKNFHDIDNLNSNSLIQNNSLFIRGRQYRITYVFYEKI